MKLSVIMPIYNCEEYLETAIHSVLTQGISELEIIAIDDCSADGSAKLLHLLSNKDRRIKAVFNERNRGVAFVRNKALELASGKYIAFCDADDTVPVGAYRAMLREIGDSDVLIGGFCDVNDGGGRRETTVSEADKSSAFLSLFSVCCLWNKLFKRSSLGGLTFEDDMKIGEDVVFLSHYSARRPSFTVTDRIVYNHHHHENAATPSLTHIYSYYAFKEHIKCRERMLKICEIGGILECRDYVYTRFSEYLDRFIPLIPNSEERKHAFELYRSFMAKYDWKKHSAEFFAITGVDYSSFIKSDFESYFRQKHDTLPREKVLFEFKAGMIGFRWIIKYLRAWLKFKLKRR